MAVKWWCAMVVLYDVLCLFTMVTMAVHENGLWWLWRSMMVGDHGRLVSGELWWHERPTRNCCPPPLNPMPVGLYPAVLCDGHQTIHNMSITIPARPSQFPVESISLLVAPTVIQRPPACLNFREVRPPSRIKSDNSRESGNAIFALAIQPSAELGRTPGLKGNHSARIVKPNNLMINLC